jgi:hypothetical protein
MDGKEKARKAIDEARQHLIIVQGLLQNALDTVNAASDDDPPPPQDDEPGPGVTPVGGEP